MWITCNILLLNSLKNEIMVLGPAHLRNKLLNGLVTLDDISLTSGNTVRNLGVVFVQDLSFDSDIKQIPRCAFFHLCSVTKTRHFLPHTDSEKFVHAFVTSRLHYCNSLLSGCTNTSLKTLQLIQKAALSLFCNVTVFMLLISPPGVPLP